MHARPDIRCLFLGLAVLLLGAAAFGQAKYRLRDTYTPGDLCAVDSSIDLSTMMTVSVPGSDEGEQQIPFTERERQSFSEKVLAVDARGPSAVRRTYTIARGVTTDPYLNEHKQVSSVQGQTVTLRRVGDKVTVSSQPGKLSEADRKSLSRDLGHSDLDLFPDHEVAPGDEWPVDAQLLAMAFPGIEKAEAQYQFVQVVPYAGHSCAKIHVTANLEGRVAGTPAPMVIKLSGDLYHAIDLKRTLAFDLSGPITISGVTVRKGVTMRVSGQGTLRLRETRRWRTVDRRPVASRG